MVLVLLHGEPLVAVAHIHTQSTATCVAAQPLSHALARNVFRPMVPWLLCKVGINAHLGVWK
jgi:hypothetical protein